MTEKNNFKSIFHASVPTLLVIVILSLFIAIEEYATLPSPGDSLEGTLDEVSKVSIDLFRELNKLFIGWSIAIIGGIGFFLKSAIEGKIKLTKKSLVFAELVILSSVFSIFFGHLSLNSILNMLALDIFSIRDEATIKYGYLQYMFFLMTLLFFFLYVHYTFWSFTSESTSEKGE
ncbi:MAG: hypothetical protein CMK03_14935 [Ponticaulis sp.]|nr:hypothetical protein [Ponticaulis sp.]